MYILPAFLSILLLPFVKFPVMSGILTEKTVFDEFTVMTLFCVIIE
jgi:hypothetical protein